MIEEEKQEYEELKSLLYTGQISQYGKRKLIDIIEKQDTEINKLNNVIDRMVEKLYEFNNNEMDKDCFIPREYSDINDCVKKNSCKDCIKDYFIKENK